MRFLNPIGVFICCTIMLISQAAYAESELSNRELLEKSGIVEAVIAIPEALIRGGDEARKANPAMEGKFLSAWNAVVPLAYRSSKILAVIDAGMQKELTEDEKRALLAFFDSDFGMRVIAMEKASQHASAAIEEYGKNPAAYADRVELYREVDRESTASEASVAILENMTIAFQVGGLVAANLPVDMDALRAEAAKDRPAMRRESEAEMLRTMAYTYRDLNADEIKAYIAFLKTPAARKFNLAFARFLNDAMTAQAGALAQMVIQNMASGQPI